MKRSHKPLLVLLSVFLISLLLFAGTALAQETTPAGAPPAGGWLGQMQQWMDEVHGPGSWGQMIQHMTQVHGPEATGEMLQWMNETGGCHGSGAGFPGMMARFR